MFAHFYATWNWSATTYQSLIFASTQLAAFAYKDYLQFGYVDQGLSETANLQKQFNINTYAPTMLVFKENIDKPADIIQVI